MKKHKRVLFLTSFLFLSIFIISRGALAQGTWREKIKEKIMERQKIRNSRAINSKNSKELGTKPGVYDVYLKHSGLTRYYKVYVPNSYDKSKKTPVVLYLHGGGGNKDTVSTDGFYKYSDKYGFILIAPEGTGKYALGKLWATWNGGAYTVGGVVAKCCGQASDKNLDDLGFISKVIDEVEKNFNVDSKRIYATGISNGGLMSYVLACNLSERIAAIAPVAPSGTPDACNPSRPVPVMHIHGTIDPIAPYDGGTGEKIFGSRDHLVQPATDVVSRWRQINGCTSTIQNSYQKGNASCVVNTECKNGSEVEFCTIEGMGHTYPSGQQYMPISKIGPVSYDISFDQVWEFFKRHPKE